MNVNANVLTWNDELRRISSYVVLGTAAVVALVALALWWFLAAPVWLYWSLVGLLALVLAFMAVLLFVPPQSAAAEEGDVMAEEPAPAPAEAMAGAAPAPAGAYEPRVLTLRCGDCGTIFEVTDTGERPLYHTCPGCGAEGALRDEPVAEPAAAPEMPAPEAPPEEPAPEPAAPVAAPKKLKLRCGGCKEIFTIEDTGERPLRRACPHCSRMGQIN